MQGVIVVEEYDKKSLYPMLLEFHHHLHPLAKSKRSFDNKGVDGYYILNIFQIITNTSELVKELVSMELLILKDGIKWM
jgi:hypothetical protein